MPNISIAPLGDWLNAGWSLIGAVSSLWQALSSMSDTVYIKAPGSKGGAAVTFPSDISTVPDGAIITSVTIMVRCSTGTGVAPSGTAPSLTLNVAASDNPSRYTAKTIQPTSTITDYEVGTYQRDAIGKAWDIFRLNFLFCRLFCWIAVPDLIRVYRIWLKINYRVRPVISVNSPSGTVYTPSPDITWSYTQADGDQQKSADYKIFTSEQVSKVSFNAATTVPIFQGSVSGDSTTVKLPTSINANTYWVYVQSTSVFGAKSIWSGRQFTVQSPTPGAPGVSDPNLPGVASLVVVPDPEYGRASITMRDTSNMYSVQAADAESAIDGAELTTVNCSYLRDSSTAFPGGISSWKMTATAAGDMGLVGDWIEIEESSEITGRAQFRTAATSRSVRVRVSYFDDQFAQISTATSTSVADSTSTWTEAVYTGVSPAGAVYARMTTEVLSAAISEVHNVDRMGLMYGTNTPWSDGGHMSRNLLSAWYSTSEGTAQAGEAWTALPGSQISTLPLPYGTGSSGSVANTMGYIGLSPSIAFRAAGTAFTSPTSGTDYTLNKPAGVVAGDLMLAFVTASEYTTITPPVGWDLAATSRAEDGSTDISLFVLKRTVDGADPASWTDGVIATGAARRTAHVVAYSGAAPASEQFPASTQIATANDTPLTLTTSSINNTDPNAWRVSAFAVSDNASGGTMTANRNAPAAVAQIQYVGVGTARGTNTTGSYTINKPAGVITGDLMIGIFMAATSATVTAPSGWTIRYQGSYTSNGGPSLLCVMYKIAGSSEPTTYSGTYTGGSSYGRNLTNSIAYRNVNAAAPFLDSVGQSIIGTNPLTTGTVTNTNSLAWRIAIFGSLTTNTARYTSNEVVERIDNGYDYTTAAESFGFYDSNGPVGTGAYSRTGTADQSPYSSNSFIGILNPLATVPSSVADETARQVATTGASNPWLTARSFDSGAVTATGLQSLTGIWTPGSGTDKNSMAGWFGLIKPAGAITAGYVQAQMAKPVDISNIDMSNITTPDKVTLTSSFIGNSGGVPYLTAQFYRANVLINTSTDVGQQFNTATWTKSSVTFDVPQGTTRIGMLLSASDRQIGDVVAFDRNSISFGEDEVYRAGTSSDVHPIFAKPQIQYADDDGTGYDDWSDLPGLSNLPPAYTPIDGLAYYTDETAVPLTSRRYRSRTTSFGLNGDLFVSDWSAGTTEVYFEAENWWLKSITHPERNLRLKVKWDDIKVGTTNSATAFQPLGEKYPVVLTEGYKGDNFTLSLVPVDHDGWISLREMLESGETLFLQSDIDHAWWVRPVGDLSAVILATNRRRQDPLRAIEISFVQVAPEK